MIRSRLSVLLVFAATFLVAAPTFAQSTTKTNTTTSKTATAKSARVDINTASKSELTSISGVDDATAQKIIDGRPYARKRQLVSKNVMPRTTYDKIKDEIVAKEKKK